MEQDNKTIFEKIRDSEQELYFYIIDLLATEYGWTIEYIQTLYLTEIAGLIKAVKARKDIEDQILQVNVAKAIAGKLGSNYTPNPNKIKEEIERAHERVSNTKEVENLEKLSKLLGIPLQGK